MKSRIPNNTRSLSTSGGVETVETLAEQSIALVKARVDPETFEGAWKAFDMKRRLDLPQRLATRAIGKLGITRGMLYEFIKPGHVQGNPLHPPFWFRSR